MTSGDQFGQCCQSLSDAMTDVPRSFFHVEKDNGVLYLTVGYVSTEHGPGGFDMAVLFCPFCGRELQTSEGIRKASEASQAKRKPRSTIAIVLLNLNPKRAGDSPQIEAYLRKRAGDVGKQVLARYLSIIVDWDIDVAVDDQAVEFTWCVDDSARAQEVAAFTEQAWKSY